MAPVRFSFNKMLQGMVFPPTKTHRVVPLRRPKEVAEVEAVFCPATYAFAIAPIGLQGQFRLSFEKEFFISGLEVDQFEDRDTDSPITASILSQEFFKNLIAAACEVGSTKAIWYPPKSRIPDASGSTSIAGPEGFTKHLPPTPSGGRGTSRKILNANGQRHTRVWNHPTEIERTVSLMEEAERLLRSAQDGRKTVDLSTKAKREQWVADKSGIWSVGTVHVQLAIARKSGLIKSGRKKK